MSEAQKASAAEMASSLMDSLATAERVIVEQVNAIGEYDSSLFPISHFRQALDALLKAERERALREAASLSWLCFHKCDVEIEVVTVDDILALISEDATDG